MIDIATLVNAKSISAAINLFVMMDKDRCGEEPARLLDDGSSDPLLLITSDYPEGNPHYAYLRTDVETLCDLRFLLREKVIEKGKFPTEFKLTDKAERLLEARRERETDKADLVGPRRDWIVVAHEQLFIDEGPTPPNLRALIGGEWDFGDKIVITCHNPEYALVHRLPLALAENDPMFIADLEEVKEDFKYADAEVDTQ